MHYSKVGAVHSEIRQPGDRADKQDKHRHTGRNEDNNNNK
jgi:hypothetical protein